MPLGRDSQGRNVLLMPYNEDLASQAIGTRLAEQTATDPEGKTPDQTTEEGKPYDKRGGGPIRRFTDIFTSLGPVQLEALGHDGYEYEIAQPTTVLAADHLGD